MKSLTKMLALAGIAAAFVATSASATTILAFTVLGAGAYTVNTGDITAATTSKTIPATQNVGASTAPGVVAPGAVVTFSTLTFSTIAGAIPAFTMTVGTLTFTFNNISSAVIVPSGVASNGSISEQFNGTVTTDASGVYLGQTASISETCTQTAIGGLISCSESVITPGLPRQVPEPMALALIGIGLAGLAFTRRKQS